MCIRDRPRKLAREATAEALNAVESARKAEKHREAVRLAEAEETARALKGKVCLLYTSPGPRQGCYAGRR